MIFVRLITFQMPDPNRCVHGIHDGECVEGKFCARGQRWFVAARRAEADCVLGTVPPIGASSWSTETPWVE